MSPFAVPPSPPLWNPRNCSDLASVVRRELIDPARPELGSRPVPSPENWIWNGRIRPGDLVAVVGEAASGKTTVLCDWMARISTGDPFPGDPEHFRREPGEVLLFNSGDTCTDTLQARLLLGGGDLGRVSLFTSDLTAWSGKPSEMPASWQTFDPSACNPQDRRAELHRKGIQKWLGSFLKNRPRIQMVVIDHVWHHMRADTERYFTPTIIELTHIARENNVVIVVSMHPNAYRNDLGPAEFLKSKELISSARSIWHTVRPTDASVQARSLQCLKLSQFPNIPGAEDPWGLFWGPRGKLEWVPGAAPRYSRSKRAREERWMWLATNFLREHLDRAGGVAEFHTLRLAARNLKIPQTWFMQAILSPEFDIDYEPYGTDELIQIIGTPATIAQRRTDPNPPALKINCPPGAADSTEYDPNLTTAIADLCAAEHAPPDPLPRYTTNLRGSFPGDSTPPAAASPHDQRTAGLSPHINLRRPTDTERVVAGHENLESATAGHLLGTPPGWIGTSQQRLDLQQNLVDELAERGVQLPADLSAREIVDQFLKSHSTPPTAGLDRPPAHPPAHPADQGPARSPSGSASRPGKPAEERTFQQTPVPRADRTADRPHPPPPGRPVSERPRGETRHITAPGVSPSGPNPSKPGPSRVSPSVAGPLGLSPLVPGPSVSGLSGAGSSGPAPTGPSSSAASSSAASSLGPRPSLVTDPGPPRSPGPPSHAPRPQWTDREPPATSPGLPPAASQRERTANSPLPDPRVPDRREPDRREPDRHGPHVAAPDPARRDPPPETGFPPTS